MFVNFFFFFYQFVVLEYIFHFIYKKVYVFIICLKIKWGGVGGKL